MVQSTATKSEKWRATMPFSFDSAFARVYAAIAINKGVRIANRPRFVRSPFIGSRNIRGRETWPAYYALYYPIVIRFPTDSRRGVTSLIIKIDFEFNYYFV